tara:strand:+ start:187 stop:495 length:309 start_codon:yes stop_codon:yes gene_type:complete
MMKLKEAVFKPDVTSIKSFIKRLHPDKIEKDEDGITFKHFYKGSGNKHAIISTIHFTPKGYYYEGGEWGVSDPASKRVKATTNLDKLFKEIKDWLWEMNAVN